MRLRRPPLHYPDRPFHHLLQDSADRHPEEVGLIFEQDRYTYRELDGIGNAFAHWLAANGIGRGDRVALVVTNRPEWVLAHHGITQVGAAAVLVNPAWKHVELEHVLALTEPRAIVADAEIAAVLEAAGAPALRISVDDPAPEGWASFWDAVYSHPGTRPTFLTDDEFADLECSLPFSSGTTGMPKAVRHSHRSLTTAAIQWKAAAVIGETDRLQFFLPLFGIYGIVTVMCALNAGAPLTLFARFDLRTMLEHIEQERITIGFGAAPIAVAMANLADLERYDLSSLRYFLWAATPISADVANRVTERSGIRWLHAYGSTEVPPLHTNPVLRPDLWRLDSPGLPDHDVEVRIVGLDTDHDVEPGAEGEILVRSPSRMLGYLPEEANEDAWRGDWFRTGDVGWVEPEGWLHITDRAKEMLKVSGFSVAPVEIEKVLFSHDGVADCAVYALSDGMGGDLAKAAVVKAEGASVSEEELRAFVAERLATYKHLRAVTFVDDIPRTASGKVLRRVLRDNDPAAPPS